MRGCGGERKKGRRKYLNIHCLQNRLQGENRMEIIKFSDFMNNNYKPQHTPKKIYSISPLAMIDPNVALIAGGVIAVAVLQTVLEQRGDYEKSEKVSSVLGFSIPCVALVFILKLLNVVSGVFL